MKRALPSLGWILVLALLALSVSAPVWALTQQEIEQRVLEITGQLRCPTCQGISVRDSEASFSRQIADKVRRMVEEGQSDAQIKAYFVSRYGEWILRAPKPEGMGLVIWLLPGLAIGVVGLLVGIRLYRNTRQTDDEPGAGAEEDITPAQLARIERDLKRFEEQD